VLCRYCDQPITAVGFNLWRHTAGLVACVFDDGFLSTTATPAPRGVVEALARDDAILTSYADKHHVPGRLRSPSSPDGAPESVVPSA